MKVDEIIHIQKFFLMLFCALFMTLGFSFFGCAAWILWDINSFIFIISSESNVQLIAVSLAVIGLIVVVVSLLGCVGGHLENKLLLKTHMGFVLIIVFGQIFVIMVLLLRQKSIVEFLDAKVKEAIQHYGNETADQVLWTITDRVQRSAKCCGFENETDWKQNKIIQSNYPGMIDDIHPCSCFNDTCPTVEDARFGKGTAIYKEVCKEKFTNWLKDNGLVIIGMALALIVVQILQFTFAILIYKNVGRKKKLKHELPLIDSMEVDPETEAKENQDSNLGYDQQHDHQSDNQQQQRHQQNYQQQHDDQSGHQQQQRHQQDYQQQHDDQSGHQQQQRHQQDYQQQHDDQSGHQQQQRHQQDYQQQHDDQSGHQQQQRHQQDYQQQHAYQSNHQLQQYHPQDYHQQDQYHQSDHQLQQYHQPDYYQQEQYHQSDYQQQQYQQDYHQQEQGQYNQHVYDDLQYY